MGSLTRSGGEGYSGDSEVVMTVWDKFCYYGGIVGFFVAVGVVVEAIRTSEHMLIVRAVPIVLASLYLHNIPRARS